MPLQPDGHLYDRTGRTTDHYYVVEAGRKVVGDYRQALKRVAKKLKEVDCDNCRIEILAMYAEINPVDILKEVEQEPGWEDAERSSN